MESKVCDIKKLMAEELQNGSNDLVTRDTGIAIRSRIEKELMNIKEGDILFIDFSRIGVMDYSCSDEIIAKLISRLIGLEYGDKYIVLAGVNSNQLENIEVALERKKLAAMGIDSDNSWRVIGKLNNYLAATLEFVMGKGEITTREFAESKKIGLNTSGTRLLNLYKKRFVARIENTTEEGGRQYVYKSLII
ncbi:MAG: hypothetical protein AB1401_03815 [Thermodesulfobacteriota bacterium]